MRGGIDQGPCLVYWRLSFRRKFIRTLWVMVVCVPVLVLFQSGGLLPWPLRQIGVPDPKGVGWALVGLCGATCVLQAAYTCGQWRLDVRGRAAPGAAAARGLGSGSGPVALTAAAAEGCRPATGAARDVERYRLERGGTVLGVVTRGGWDGHQGSWPDWGWLEPAPGTGAAIELQVAEGRLHDEAVRTARAGGDPSGPLAEAARVQAEFMRPGVVLVPLASGGRLGVDECHAADGRVFWR